MHPARSRSPVRSSLLVVIPALVISACTMFQETGTISREPLAEDEGVVFGSVIPEVQSGGTGLMPEDTTHFIDIAPVGPERWARDEPDAIFPEDKRIRFPRIGFSLKKPRTLFVKRLPAGRYTMRRLAATRGEVRIDIRFRVVPGRATYIGSLKLAFHGGQLLGVSVMTHVQLRVIDDFGIVTKMYEELNPGSPWETGQELMEIRR